MQSQCLCACFDSKIGFSLASNQFICLFSVKESRSLLQCSRCFGWVQFFRCFLGAKELGFFRSFPWARNLLLLVFFCFVFNLLLWKRNQIRVANGFSSPIYFIIVFFAVVEIIVSNTFDVQFYRIYTTNWSNSYDLRTMCVLLIHSFAFYIHFFVIRVPIQAHL